MEQYMKGSGRMVKLMERENIIYLIILIFKEPPKKISLKVEEDWFTKMEIIIKETWIREWPMDKGFMFKVISHIKEILKTTFNMEREINSTNFILIKDSTKMDKSIKEHSFWRENRNFNIQDNLKIIKCTVMEHLWTKLENMREVLLMVWSKATGLFTGLTDLITKGNMWTTKSTVTVNYLTEKERT
jgi:hypothetical protein